MSLKQTSNTPIVGRAEAAFRSAFERLRTNKPNLMSKGTQVTQNNVAREAGLDPSALKKARFPHLVAEIQAWVENSAETTTRSQRQTVIAQRTRSRELRVRLEAMKTQRDHALALLVEADARILELIAENTRLKATLPPTNVTMIRG